MTGRLENAGRATFSWTSMHLWRESWRELPFHSGTAAVEITIRRILFFPFVFLSFLAIWFFYPIHLFFLFWFSFSI